MRRRYGFNGAAVIVGLLLAGCASAGSDDSQQQPEHPTHRPTAASAAPAEGAEDADHPNDHGLMEAAKTSLNKLTDATLAKIDWDSEDEVWEVSVVYKDGKRKELDVSADGSQIKDGPDQIQQADAAKSKWRQRVKAAQLDYETAYSKVVDARKGWVTELRLDEHLNKPAWEAEMKSHGANYEITINARSGEVVENEAD